MTLFNKAKQITLPKTITNTKSWLSDEDIKNFFIKLEAAKQTNNELSQAIKDAQGIRDYSEQAVKSVNVK